MKSLILTPGPTPLPDFVRQALSKPILHHRTSQFQEILGDAEEGLKYIYQTKNQVWIFASSGTGAMESAVANVMRRGKKCLVIEGGKFGQRWREIAVSYGLEVISLEIEWGTAVDPNKVDEILAKDKDIIAVFATHCETSTGVDNDIEALAKVTEAKDVLLVVDAISSLGVSPLKMDEWGVDVVVSGSQKGLMLPPGLAFVAVSERSFDWIEKSDLPRYYFDWRKYKKSMDKTDTPYTPAVSLIVALKEVVNYYKQVGIENLWKKYSKMAEAVRTAMEEMGLKLFSARPSNGVTAVKVPEGVDGGKLVKQMRNVYGVSIAGGQAHLKGKIFRLAHMGWIDEFDIVSGISCLEVVLEELGFKLEKSGLPVARRLLFAGDK